MKTRFALAIAVVCTGCVSIGPGYIRIVDHSDQADAQTIAQAAAVAAAIAGKLRELEGSLGRWQECLDRGSCSQQQFLSSTESALLKILAAPELAALRDWVREGYRTAELQLQTTGAAGTTH